MGIIILLACEGLLLSFFVGTLVVKWYQIKTEKVIQRRHYKKE